MAISRPHNWLRRDLVSSRRTIRAATRSGGLNWGVHLNLHSLNFYEPCQAVFCYVKLDLSRASSLLTQPMSVKCVCSHFPLGKPQAVCWCTPALNVFYQNDLETKPFRLFLRRKVQERNSGGRTELPAPDQRWRRASRTAGEICLLILIRKRLFTLKPQDPSDRNCHADGNCLETDHYISAGLFGAVWWHTVVVLPKALKGQQQINE